METLRIVDRFKWQCNAGTVDYEKAEGVEGYWYVVRAPHGYRYLCETLDEAMGKLGCNKVEVSKREAAELARD